MMTETEAADKPAEKKATKDSDNDVPTRDLFNANDGIHGRQGGPYLDQVEQLQHEVLSAAREGSEPDLDNPRSYPGIQLNTAAQQVADYNPTLLAGDDRRDGATFDAVPVFTDVPVTPSVLSDFSITDTEDKGDKKDTALGDLPVEGETNALDVSKASVTGFSIQ